MNTVKYLLYVAVILSVFSGCARRGTLVKCEKNTYEEFLQVYRPFLDIDNLKANGEFEINTEEKEFFGNFSMNYSKKPEKLSITLFGFFGMVLSNILIENDSISISSSLLDRAYKSSLENSRLGEHTGISINPRLIPLLATGRIPLPAKGYPSSCRVKNEDLVEFVFEDKTEKVVFEWNKCKKEISYYISEEKNTGRVLKANFGNYKNVKSLHIPYSIAFVFRSKEKGYLKMKYSYIGVGEK